VHGESVPVADTDRAERIMGLRPPVWRFIERGVRSGRIIPYLAGITIVVALAMALVLRVFDREDFASYGSAVWFSVVTITTVGYGDIVPTTVVGRTLAGALTVFGVTFIAFVTAVVTSALITSQQRRVDGDLGPPGGALPADGSAEALARIERRLDAIERKLDR
jgi:voltage-gated potassium channel Kch